MSAKYVVDEQQQFITTMMNSLMFSRHTIFTTKLFSHKIHPSFTRPYTISPTLPRTKSSSFSPSFSASYDAVSPLNSPNFPILGLGFFLSLSSRNPNFRPPSSGNPNSCNSDAKFFTWHSPASESGGGGGAGGGSTVAAVVLGWLGAKERHLRRYAELYTSRGIDAITFVVPLKDAMRADLGKSVEDRIEVLAKEIVSWLSNDGGGREKSLIFHTFSSTGWLVYGSILAHMEGKPELVKKIKGCIVDSGGAPELDPKVWAAGFGTALLKKRNGRVASLAEAKSATDTENGKPKLQGKDPDILEAVVLYVLEILFTFVFKLSEVNQKLSKIISRLTEDQPPCPQLYLYSTADNVIPYRSVESFLEYQKMKGRTVRSFNFVSSPHVDHFRTFPDVYSLLVNNFVDEILKK